MDEATRVDVLSGWRGGGTERILCLDQNSAMLDSLIVHRKERVEVIHIPSLLCGNSPSAFSVVTSSFDLSRVAQLVVQCELLVRSFAFNAIFALTYIPGRKHLAGLHG